MREILRADTDENNLAGSGCTPISIGGMRDSFGIDCGMWDLNSK